MEQLTVGTRLHGFTVTRVREVAERSAALVEMTHDRTGAGLCWLDNGVDNKLFSVAFKTLPEDDTGVFHILEHSVLCGSAKYPVREPFVELLKSSMNTFLNAMTWPDKTVYPVSSRNEQDFLNLADVYLDAVFAPRILQDPNIFCQEGWHVALEGEKSFYRGVVFNEMKGAMSSVNDVVMQGICELLFPDTCYRFSSGGDPEAIPNLTYEQFVEIYRRFYHPSNARFYLDGAIPLDRTLALIEKSLQGFDRRADLPQLALQQPVARSGKRYYEIAPDADPSGKTYLTMGRILCSWQEPEKCIATLVLCDTLADSNEAPLKKAILQAGLCQDVSLTVEDGVAQPWLQLTARNLSDGRAADFRQCVLATARQLAESGLDREALEASLNAWEFRLRQPQEPQALRRCLNVLESWLYDGDPLQNLTYEGLFRNLRAMLETGGYEALLRELFLDDAGWSVLEVAPSPTLGEEKRAREAARLTAEQAAWTPEQWAACRQRNESLKQWQQTPDTPEQLATLPVLPLSEVSAEPEYPDTTVEDVHGVTVLRHKADCHGVAHLTLYFPLTDYTLPELTKISVLRDLFGKLPTKRHSAADLHRQIKSVFGALAFTTKAFSRGTERCTPCLTVSASVLEANLPHAKALLTEILTETLFEDPDRIRRTVCQADEKLKLRGPAIGHQMSMLNTKAHYSAQNAVLAAVDGWTYAQWLHRFAAAFDAELAPFLELVRRVTGQAIGARRLVLSVTASGPVEVAEWLAAFPAGTAAEKDAVYTTNLPRDQAIRVASQVGYASQAFRVTSGAQRTRGSLRVAAQILSLDYLWNRVRVQGGAYGSGLLVDREGTAGAYSFRDPSPDRSLAVYGGLAQALRDFCAGGEPLDKYIISTVARTEPLQSAQQYGQKADGFWFSGVTREEERIFRQELLATDAPALLAWCEELDRMAAEGARCVLAPDALLDACEPLAWERVDW